VEKTRQQMDGSMKKRTQGSIFAISKPVGNWTEELKKEYLKDKVIEAVDGESWTPTST
jgi:hypothetical protein